MSWYGIDAIDKAVSRTRRALFEPFEFWKWVKLAIITFLLGIIANYGNLYRMVFEDLKNKFPNIDSISWQISHNLFIENFYSSGTFLSQYGLLIAVIVGLILLSLLFYYISNIMEFVFVESLVRNKVKFWAYSRRFLGKGFSLLLIRLVLVLVFLVLFIITMLPLVPRILEKPSDLVWPTLLGEFLWIFGVIFLLTLIWTVIESFLSLAIPLSIYRNMGILSALRLVFANLRRSWQQVLVYWFIRFVLGIVIAILVMILFLAVLLSLGITFLVVDGVLYFFFSLFASDPLKWWLMIPFIIIELLLLFVTLFLLNVPFAVFLKYHLLSFLEAWFAGADIPFFDAPAPEIKTDLSGPEPNF